MNLIILPTLYWLFLTSGPCFFASYFLGLYIKCFLIFLVDSSSETTNENCPDTCFDVYLLDICDKYRLTQRSGEYGMKIMNYFIQHFTNEENGQVSGEQVKKWFINTSSIPKISINTIPYILWRFISSRRENVSERNKS